MGRRHRRRKSRRPDPVFYEPEGQTDRFFRTEEWFKLRDSAFVLAGWRCQTCGRGARSGQCIFAEVLPGRESVLFHRLGPMDLEVLCEDCSVGRRYHGSLFAAEFQDAMSEKDPN